MRRYSAVFCSNGTYRHITTATYYEAQTILTDFAIERLMEPIGIYDSAKDTFEYSPEKAAEITAFIDNYRTIMLHEITSSVKRLRKK